MFTLIVCTGILLFLGSAYIVLKVIVFVSSSAIRECNAVWLRYKDVGSVNTSFMKNCIDEYKSLKEYVICFGKTIPGFVIVCLCYLYLSRIPRWFYQSDAGLAFIAQVDNSWLLRNVVVWGVRFLFIFAFVLPMLREDYRAMEFPFSIWKTLSESHSLRDLRTSRGIVFFVLWMNAVILLPVIFSYDAMVGRWGG